jgi:hypothetical protein
VLKVFDVCLHDYQIVRFRDFQFIFYRAVRCGFVGEEVPMTNKESVPIGRDA